MRRAVVAALGVAAVVIAGCSNSSSGGGDTAPATSSPASASPTASASASASESPSKSPKPTPSFSSTVSASQRCLTKHLHLTLGQGQGVAGASVTPIVFTNVGKRPCTLFGYPGVSFLDANGAQIGADARHTGGQQATVTLGPNDTANAQLQVPDPGTFSPEDCKATRAEELRVYPPGSFTALTVADPVMVCSTPAGASNVHPVAPGNGG
jgi:hypothetical protein